MPKATLSFNLPEEREEYEDAINGTKYKIQIDDTWNALFRPYYKHGYSDPEINELLEKEDAVKLFEKLVELYRNLSAE